jgi:REP element-mobilizing transposase RayT
MLSGIPVHITHRGNNRQRCFYEESDRAFYLFHLRRLLPQAQCALHAYCLMSNHVHLLLTPGKLDSCALLMKRLAQLHTQYVNRTYQRTGTLWEGRFDSSLVQSESYLFNCYKYVELNPVEAGLCQHPADYEWSSCRANANGAFDAAIKPHAEYLSLAALPMRAGPPTASCSPRRYRAKAAKRLKGRRTEISSWETKPSNRPSRGRLEGEHILQRQDVRPNRSGPTTVSRISSSGRKTWSVPD